MNKNGIHNQIKSNQIKSNENVNQIMLLQIAFKESISG